MVFHYILIISKYTNKNKDSSWEYKQYMFRKQFFILFYFIFIFLLSIRPPPGLLPVLGPLMKRALYLQATTAG